jgi:hypothetical protein
VKVQHNQHRVAEDPESEEFYCLDCRCYFPKADYESPYRNGMTPYCLWRDNVTIAAPTGAEPAS